MKQRPLLVKVLLGSLASTILLVALSEFGAIYFFQSYPKAFIQVFHFDLWVVDEHGKLISQTAHGPLPYPWEKLPHPTGKGALLLSEPLPEGGWAAVQRLEGVRPTFVVMRRKMDFHQRAINLSRIFFFSLLVACLGAGFWILLSLHYLRGKASLAESVLQRLRAGDLKARFPIGHLDEMTSMMLKFNEMADEVERLVERLRRAESARVKMLQELAHDVRTPLFSLGNVLGSLWENRVRLTPEILEESLQLGREEVAYFTRLIEDLFLLAQLGERDYRPPNEALLPLEVLKAELQTVREIEAKGRSARRFSLADGTDGTWWLCVEPFLLRRLFRNLLDNAREFARAEVMIQVSEDARGLRIKIGDDGPGLSEEAIAHYGERRNSRFLDASRNGRLSLGLGSVIVKTILSSLQGELSVGNWKRADGSVGGAEIRLLLPAERDRRAAAG